MFNGEARAPGYDCGTTSDRAVMHHSLRDTMPGNPLLAEFKAKLHVVYKPRIS